MLFRSGIKVTKKEAQGEFFRATRERQIELLKMAFRGSAGEKRVYLDRNSLNKDIVKATIFMKKAGLTNAQIKDRLSALFPNLFNKPLIVQATGGGNLEAKQQFTKTITGTRFKSPTKNKLFLNKLNLKSSQFLAVNQFEKLGLNLQTKQKQNSLQKTNQRSEERRVGKECRSRWSPYH